MRVPASAALLCALIAMLSTAAEACGACDEDKMAATYDHAVVQRAAASGDVMVYCAISGPLGHERVRQAASRVPGVRVDSVRISAQPAALSFAVDPTVRTPQAAIDMAQRDLPSNLRVSLVRLVLPEPSDAR